MRGLTLANAGRDGIRVEEGATDIIIEECDIHGWGEIDSDAGAGGPGSEAWGKYGNAGVYSNADNTRFMLHHIWSNVLERE